MISSLIALAIPISLAAQTAEPAFVVIDTVDVYNCNFGSRTTAEGITYIINDAPVTKAEYERVTHGFNAKKNCNPCFMRELELNGTLHATGMYYYDCPAKPTEAPKVTSAPGQTSMTYVSNSCRHGEWKYYKKNGKYKTVYFDMGKKVKKKS
jgi:hypothetical protein